MTMVVNMAYVRKPESGTKVLKMTPPWNGSADIIVDFIGMSLFSINIIHSISLTPHKNTISAVLFAFYLRASQISPSCCTVLLHNDKWLKKISTKFCQICRHCNVSPYICPINATYSSSYLFRLQYPRVLHCRIVPVEKLKTLVALERKKPPITRLGSESKINNLKVTRKFAKTPRRLLDRGGGYFYETLVRHHSNRTKFLWLMIKIRKYLLFLS
jgi:hypothetical protein